MEIWRTCQFQPSQDYDFVRPRGLTWSWTAWQASQLPAHCEDVWCVKGSKPAIQLGSHLIRQKLWPLQGQADYFCECRIKEGNAQLSNVKGFYLVSHLGIFCKFTVAKSYSLSSSMYLCTSMICSLDATTASAQIWSRKLAFVYTEVFVASS